MASKEKAAPAAAGTDIVSADKARELAVAADELFAGHAGAGLENVTARDILVPRIGILQGLSPQLVKTKPEYNADARVGQIYDIGLGEIIGDEMMFLPLLYKMQWLEWYPRSTGKGLAKIHDTNAVLSHCSPDEKNRPILPNGNYVAETAQFFGLNMTLKNRLSFLPMASTQLKKARQWLTLATSEKLPSANGGEYTPPLFYRAYNLSTVPESNNDGDWVGWKIERGPKLSEIEGGMAMFDMLVETQKQISSGAVKGDVAGLDGEVREGASADDSKAM